MKVKKFWDNILDNLHLKDRLEFQPIPRLKLDDTTAKEFSARGGQQRIITPLWRL
jgi:hypothetical protein